MEENHVDPVKRQDLARLIIFVIRKLKDMVVKLKRSDSAQDIKKAILTFDKKASKRRAFRKEQIIEETFGKMLFNDDKTPLAIQDELRDEWS